MKEISLKQSVYEICTAHPEIKEIMQELGFVNITKPGMLQSVGKFMTIPKGCRTMRIPLEKVKEHFEANGYKLVD